MPVLNGTNHDEERIFVSIGLTVSQGTDVPIPETPVTPGNYQANIAAALGVTAARAAQIAAEYPPGNDKASATVAFSALAGDASFACPALRIDQQTSQRVPAYAYEFKRRQRAADLHRAAVPTARGGARVRAPVPVRPAQRALPHPRLTPASKRSRPACKRPGRTCPGPLLQGCKTAGLLTPVCA